MAVVAAAGQLGMRRGWAILPLLIATLLVAAFIWRLGNPPTTVVRSQMIGQPLPRFTIASATPGKAGFSSADLATGKPRLVNFFASWCVPCIAEAPMLEILKRQGVEIDGIAIRDRPGDVAAFLHENGDPYARIGADPRSAVQLAMGSAGVPESFVVDGRGIIRFQWPGPITEGDVPTIIAEIEKAR